MIGLYGLYEDFNHKIYFNFDYIELINSIFSIFKNFNDMKDEFFYLKNILFDYEFFTKMIWLDF
ncbi:hypothetical protein F0310_03405 [Borrelia sp. A-FGy1]|uniref:hypothetical protein n=1 Tax=Borrelia sp. A-FGy1 TaxID=2608247 RepID=UPI0015F75612|nr:hypothetical protein [Borrelia sp. A-FGy1]QMU99439.1 hypothetical protein F0310_03405 [Borrelia sp. A-FGy1]